MPSDKSLRVNNFFTGLNTLIVTLVGLLVAWQLKETVELKTVTAGMVVQIQQAAKADEYLQKELDRDQSILDEHGKRIQTLELRVNVRNQP